MGIRLPRKKKRIFLLTFLYRLNKLVFFISGKTKLKLFLDLEWIFERLAHEETEKYFPPQQHPIRTVAYDFMKKHIGPDSVVCDIGCKYGHISFMLSGIASQVTGIDYDSDAIEYAKKNYHNPNLEFFCENAFDFLRKTDRKFNTLVLSHVLEHQDDPEQFLNLAKKHFRYMYIEVPDFEKSYLNRYRVMVKNDLIFSDADHINEFERADLVSLLEKCSLKILDSEYRYGVQRIWCSS